ncbi:MAG: heme biosynthesis protein HemY [Gammaproteobacteria bacterium]|nr:heme biosynthesis protein HemY [Gammaproteobacteria bacterium]
MKFGLIVVVTLIVSAFAAHFLLQDPGYVVINFHQYVIEMSVPVLVALIFLGVFSFWLIAKLVRVPRKLGQVAGRYRSGRAGQRLTHGMIQIAEGNFAKGERLLARAARASDAPLLNYLQAARAAHLLGQNERRDSWLKQAYEQLPEAASAVLLTQAEFQIDQRDYEQALATLRKLEEDTPNHSHALELLGRVYIELEDWRQLASLLPRLRKFGRIDADVFQEWSLRVHREQLSSAADGDTLIALWSEVPKTLRSDPHLLEVYYAALIEAGMHEKAEKELVGVLKKQWLGALVRLFGTVQGKDAAKQLKRAENWLGAHGDDADLLLTTARLCLRNELWGKARSYIETVISLQPTPEAYQEYGRLLNRLGEGEAAADAYRTGLGLVSRSPLPAIAHLDADLTQDTPH